MKVHCPPPAGDKPIIATEILYVRNVVKPTEVEDGSPAMGMLLTLDAKTYTLETPAEVKDLADAERPSDKALSLLSSKNHWPIYFDGARAEGPLQITENEVNKSGYNSAFLIGKKKIPVINSAQEVFDVVAAAGGKTRPVLPPAKSISSVTRDLAGDWDESIKLFPSPGGAPTF
ncbi:hypothetical protein [Neorhizobium galegae]|uniref:hypothetical protein n=1 Tax=Neorhizobium galegae TaxID=399 RepID=UPI002105D243|nr:hypothetical protein [Neorhizobium galegae]MCQ1839072.1 hypothetical protein [Neorhizobium galegae]